MTKSQISINNCNNNLPTKSFFKNDLYSNNLCITEDILTITNNFNNLCRCDNGLIGFTTTGNKKDCNCYGTQNKRFTFFDNFKADVIVEKVLLIRTLIILILLIPLINSFRKMKTENKYFPNKNYRVSNSRLVPMLFGILFIYTIYLLFLYFKNM